MATAGNWRLVLLPLSLGLAAGFGALTGCLPDDWDHQTMKNKGPDTKQGKQDFNYLWGNAQVTPVPQAATPQVADISPGGVRWPAVVNPAIQREMDRFYFTITFSQPISLQSLSAQGATLLLATYPGKTPPGPRVMNLTGTFTPAGPDLKSALFTSHQYATDLVQAAGWQTAQEIHAIRSSITVQVVLFGTAPKPGQPVVTGATGVPLDGDKNGQAGGNFSAGFPYGKTMFP